MVSKATKLEKFVCLFFILLFLRITVTAQFRGTDYEVAAKDAAWCWFSDPRAVYHKGKSEKIYYGYINSKGDVVISSRDLKTKYMETFVLHKELQIDDHNVPSLMFLPDGRLLAFYTEHNGRFFMRKSKNPEDISSWETERVIPFGGNRITYSHPVMLKGEKNRIYMFWRGSDWRPSFAFSDDLGETWSETKALIESKGKKNRPYLKVSSDNKNRIDFTFTDGHPSIEPTNSVYHIYYEKGAFYQTNGERIASLKQLPLEHSHVNKVYDGTTGNVRGWISDISLNRKKQPVIVYTRYPEDTDHRYYYARWDGKKWQHEEICKAGGWMPIVKPGEKIREPHYSGGISLDHNNPLNVYLSREINGIFEIEHWQKLKNRWAVGKVTSQSKLSNMRPYVVHGYSGRNPVVLWMSGLYNHYTRFDTNLLINEIKHK
ncbi:BNR-4 repeat-containing protein [Pseudopedobacter sp.]|uniref:BNR-4 repeat-containing protein n=1 Tax=Pseudopedobacter sp. TaxID=1936787 RepID=UPI00333F4796